MRTFQRAPFLVFCLVAVLCGGVMLTTSAPGYPPQEERPLALASPSGAALGGAPSEATTAGPLRPRAPKAAPPIERGATRTGSVAATPGSVSTAGDYVPGDDNNPGVARGEGDVVRAGDPATGVSTSPTAGAPSGSSAPGTRAPERAGGSTGPGPGSGTSASASPSPADATDLDASEYGPSGPPVDPPTGPMTPPVPTASPTTTPSGGATDPGASLAPEPSTPQPTTSERTRAPEPSTPAPPAPSAPPEAAPAAEAPAGGEDLTPGA